MLAAAALVALAAVLKAVPYVTLWFDEATFFVNVRDTPWSQILAPLPYYDQSAPAGYTILLKLIYTVSGLNEYALRIPSIIAYLGILVGAARFPGLSRLESAVFALGILCSAVVLDYSFQAKHYIVELFFLVLVIRSFILAPQQGKRAWHPFLITCLAVPFATTLLVILAALAAVWLFEEVLRLRARQGAARFESSGAGHSGSQLRDWGIGFTRRMSPLAASSVVALVAYALLVRPAVEPQIGNYRYAFDFAYPDGFMFYVRSVADIIASHYAAGTALNLLLAALGALGFFIAATRSSQTSRVFVAIVLVVLVLNLLRMFPLLPGRYSIVLLPSMACFLALGVTLVSRIKPGLPSKVLLACIVAALLISPARFARNPRGQQAKETVELAESVAGRRSTPLLVTMGSQPIIDAYLFSDHRPKSDCFPASGTWTNRCTVIRREGQTPRFSGASTPWFVMGYIAHTSWGGQVRDVDPERVRLWRQEYVDFIRSTACNSGRAYIVNSLLDTRFVTMLSSALALNGRVKTVVDENWGEYTGDGRVLYYERTATSCDAGVRH